MLPRSRRLRLLCLCVVALLGAALATACSRNDPTPDASAASSAAASDSSADAGAQRVAVRVTAKGYEPGEVHFAQGKKAYIDFTREVDSECLNAVKMPWMKEAKPLPKGETVSIAVDTSRAGAFSYSCWMSMVFGRVVIDP